MFKHLLDIKNLSVDEILKIVNLASDFEQNKAVSTCRDKHLSLLFCENSTRTRFSFEMAANRLGVFVYNFDAGKSSFSKGETIVDTIENLAAIGIDCVAIRHSEAGIIDKTITQLKSQVKIINAGDGNHAHPTQALLDFYTMRSHLSTIEGKKIVIVGDIAHSRVAHSNVELLKKFGAKIHLCAPEYFKDKSIDGVVWEESLESALKNADVAMFLRIQNERLESNIPVDEYIKDYGLTIEKLQAFAPPNIMIMHPGPVNRGVELSSDIVDREYGKIILEQARNGVFVRMAILELLLGGLE